MTLLAPETHIRRETGASIFANMLFSLIFFLLLFGFSGPLALRDLGVDFIPQFFMVALMSVIVPGFLTARKLAAGKVARGTTSPLPKRRIARALLLAAIAGACGAVIGLLLSTFAGTAVLGWWPALALKIAAGGLVAAIVTPIGLRAELA